MFGKITIAAAAGLGLALLSLPADAAVSVLGGSLASSCYQAAQYGGSVRDGIRVCDMALLESALSTRDRAATMINLGILRSQNDDPHGAFASYNQGLALDASLGEGYVDRGATEIVLKDYQAAIADISKGLALNANRPEIAYYDRALANEAIGNIRDAYLDYKKAVEIRPDFELANEQLMRFKVVRRGSNGA